MAYYPSLLKGGGLHSRPANLAGFSRSSTATGNSPSSVKRGYPNRILACANHGTSAHRSANMALHQLGLRQGASEQDIKKAYRKLALKFHPDVCKGDSCTSNFMQINDAYEEVIMDCLQGNAKALPMEPFIGESMMGVYDENWDDGRNGWVGKGLELWITLPTSTMLSKGIFTLFFALPYNQEGLQKKSS